MVGLVLAGKYRIESVLGRGGMGDVYLATQIPLDTKVVVKTLRPELAEQKHLASRFYREAKATSELRHPNCVQIIDFGESDGRPFIAMEYLRGETLADLLKRENKLTPLRLIHIAKQILDCVESAHRLSIVHRDLKPSNIMLIDLPTQKDYVKVVDFGIAKITDPLRQDGHQTKTGHVLGTPAYMAPEQAQGRMVDGRTDLYAISVICYRALSGRFPFSAKSSWGLLAAQITKDPVPLGHAAPDLPPNLAALMDRGLAKEPRHRPQSALEFKRALEEIERELSGESRRAEERREEPVRSSTVMLKPQTAAEVLGTTPSGSGSAPSLESSFPPCPRCGAGVAPSMKFCGECGAPTGKSKAFKTGIADRFADLRRYLPSALVDELSMVEASGPSEQREIVVMVADFSGKLIENQDGGTTEMEAIGTSLEEIAVRRSGYLERRHDGSLAVLFGLSVSHGDDVERAIRTALELQAFVQERGKETWRLAASIAIHAGEAQVRPSREGIDYTALSDTVSLPTRLSQAMEPGMVILTEKVHPRAPAGTKLKRGRPIHLKTSHQPIAVYEVLAFDAAGDTSTRLPAPPLVGRDDQLATVAALATSGQEKRLIHVSGEPGVGKSRFVEALAKKLSETSRSIIFIRYAESDNTRSSALVNVMFQAFGGTEAALRALGAPDHSAQLLDRFREEKTGRIGSLNEVDSRLAIASAVRSSLQCIAVRRPVTLIFDDLQHADPIAIELVRGHTRVPMVGVSLVTAARPAYNMPWQEEENVDVLSVPLPLLTRANIAGIVRGCLAPTPVPDELVNLISSKAGGSPLLAIELLRHLIDKGVLRGMGGRWEVTGELMAVTLPDRLGDIIGARVDGLPGYARDVLACAAALGEEFWSQIVDAILAPSRGAPVDKELNLLREKGFFDSCAEPGRLRFVEAMVREAVYARMTEDTRRRLHAAIGIALETAPTGVKELPEEVARHLKMGGDRMRALHWYQQAAIDARAANDTVRSLRVLRACIRTGREVLEHGFTREVALGLAENVASLTEASLKLGEIGRLAAVIDEGLILARKVDEPPLIGRLFRLKGRYLTEAGKLEPALESLQLALESAIGLRNQALEAEVHCDIGEAREKNGDHEQAQKYLLRALELVQKERADSVAMLTLRVLTALGRVALRTGEIDRAERFFDQALSMAESLGEAQWAAKLLGNIGGVYHAREEYDIATEFVERALALSKDCGDQIGAARHSNNLGTLHLLAGNRHEAKSQFSNAYELAQSVGWREGMAMASAGQAQVRN